jgi:hypothetical protein
LAWTPLKQNKQTKNCLQAKLSFTKYDLIFTICAVDIAAFPTPFKPTDFNTISQREDSGNNLDLYLYV